MPRPQSKRDAICELAEEQLKLLQQIRGTVLTGNSIMRDGIMYASVLDMIAKARKVLYKGGGRERHST